MSQSTIAAIRHDDTKANITLLMTTNCAALLPEGPALRPEGSDGCDMVGDERVYNRTKAVGRFAAKSSLRRRQPTRGQCPTVSGGEPLAVRMCPFKTPGQHVPDGRRG